MNIAFLSSLKPTDIHNWSGTLYFMYKTLSDNHDVTWIGGQIFQDAMSCHKRNESQDVVFQPEDYSKVFGMILSRKFKDEYYDLIICRDYFFLAYLHTDIPVIYIGDTNFKLFNEYLRLTDSSVISRNDMLEQMAITKARYVVYPSMWAKECAVRYYGKEARNVEIIEFGANLSHVPLYREHTPEGECHLLFIGTNWHMKGGDKAVAIHNILSSMGVASHLTIVGCTPPYQVSDDRITIYPYVDKSSKEGMEVFDRLLTDSDFLIAPTLFDCFGIVNCEAAAYGLPVLTVDAGGVSQVVKDGGNGFLFKSDSTPKEWADSVIKLLKNPDYYKTISNQARKEYEERLNWKQWGRRMGELFTKVAKSPDVYISTYAINMKDRTDRRSHILDEFNGREEFDFHLTDAHIDVDGRRGLWNSIVAIVRKAKEDGEPVIIICEDDHFFTKSYSPNLLMPEIQKAYQLGANLLLGGIGGFGTAVPVAFRLYQVDWFWCTQFMVIYSSLFDSILSYQFQDNDTADGILSYITPKKMVIFPFISEQKDFGYSDVTLSNKEHPGRIREHFAESNLRLSLIEKLYKS